MTRIDFLERMEAKVCIAEIKKMAPTYEHPWPTPPTFIVTYKGITA
ncbi:MAG: hypothetical protein KGL39_16625 [Patescibacteria group bacterium]|nr:hypothetical protein [Patescibacteria group bacterium]